MAEYKLEPNTRKYKEEKRSKERPKTTARIEAPVMKPKQSGFMQVFRFFFDESPKEAIHRAVREEALPGVKHLAFNAMSAVLGNMFGEDTSYSSRPGDRPSYREYDKYGKRGSQNDSRKTVSRTGFEEFRDWTFSRHDAETIFKALEDSIMDYGDAPIAIIYEACQQVPEEAHYNYGWTDLAKADIIHTRAGWKLQLPKVEAID